MNMTLLFILPKQAIGMCCSVVRLTTYQRHFQIKLYFRVQRITNVGA